MKTKIILLLLLFISIYGNSQSNIKPIVKTAKYFDKTPKKLKNMKLIKPGDIEHKKWKEKGIPNQQYMKQNIAKKIINLPEISDPIVQSHMGEMHFAEPIISEDGIGNVNGVLPPDTDGDVGPNHHVQMVNLCFQIFDKNGNSIFGPADNSTLWDGFGDPWDGSNDGDPIVLYDEEADRWLMSQFALPNYPNGPFYILIAISETNDPTDDWFRYGFEFDDMPDYPKFSIWNDGYYMSVNQFSSGTLNWDGVGAAVFERDAMLNGEEDARMIFFDLDATEDPQSMLPADFDGILPPLGTPNLFLYFNDNSWGYDNDELRIWEFRTDWDNVDNSTFQESQIITTANFDSDMCGGSRNCISQPSTSQGLDALSNRLMYRVQYRNFGQYQTMVLNHTVDVGDDHAGIRWYELRSNENNNWNIHQQGTYSPDDENRWMGSIAMNSFGDIMLGYSVSSTDEFPSIRYTGRLDSDPLGIMTLNEETIVNGGGSQTHLSGRWGDYSMMSIDPIDDYTFWYTQEYVESTGSSSWRTRIASFQSVDCESDITLCNQVINNNESINVRSSNTIEASNYTINSGATVNLIAANSITLNAGFIANSGAEFTTSIKDCSEPLNITNQSFQSLKNATIKSSTNSNTLNDERINNTFNIYSNPTNEKINIVGYNDDIIINAYIFNMNGNLLLSREIENNQGVLDISQFKPGLYILVIRDANGNDFSARRIILK